MQGPVSERVKMLATVLQAGLLLIRQDLTQGNDLSAGDNRPAPVPP